MVKLEETFTIEFEEIKIVRIHCGHCSQELAEFSKVKKINKIWELEETNIDWDVEYTIKCYKVFCKCAQILAVAVRHGIFHLNKKAIKLKY